MNVYDDFLPTHEFKVIHDCLTSLQFDWHYLNGLVKDDDPKGSFQFVHGFFDPDTSCTCPYFNVFDSTLNKLGVKSLKRVKANLTTRCNEPLYSSFHIDYPNITTAILYLNTNNGYTEFESGEKVNSVGNRIVVFDSNLKHRTVTCTDQKTRIVINFNYEI
tara:strand:+ start:622 stop:1104 length:483 start_codon:yes stop_codon:yes gene_type:complete